MDPGNTVRRHFSQDGEESKASRETNLTQTQAPFFRIYNKYQNNYENACLAFEKCQKDEDFMKFVDVSPVLHSSGYTSYIGAGH